MLFLTTSVDNVDRLFGLDPQLLFDSAIQLVAIFVLFLSLSYLLFDPVRDLLKRRQERIKSDMDEAKAAQKEADDLRIEYSEKLTNVDKEAQEILSESRKKALKRENEIINEAKAEAGRITERANKEIELEKGRVRDEMKKEMISVASLMAGKFVAASLDDKQQENLINETLKEMGDKTWQS